MVTFLPKVNEIKPFNKLRLHTFLKNSTLSPQFNRRNMTKFLVIYHAPPEAMAKMGTATQEEKEAGMKAWMDWKAQMGDKVLDFGSPLMPGTKIDPNGSESPANNDNTGYSLIQAADLNEAKSMLKNHPHLQWEPGCKISVHECINMG